MDNKEVPAAAPAQPVPPHPQLKDPSLPQPINIEPTFIYERIAKEKGISLEEAKKVFEQMPDPQPSPEIQNAQEQVSSEQSFWNTKLTRRGLLKAGAVGAAAAGAAIIDSKINNPSLLSSAWNWVTGHREERINQKKDSVKPNEDIQKTADSKAQDLEPKPNYDKLNLILTKQPETKERIALELEYVIGAQTLEQIDIGLHVVNNWILRAALIEKRYQLRKQGKYGLRQPTKAELAFAQKKQIHIESLIIATDERYEAKHDLENLRSQLKPEKFFEIFKSDLLREIRRDELPKDVVDNLEVDDMLPNVGVMIGLLWHESRGMYKGDKEDLPKGIYIERNIWYLGANIGNTPALGAIKGSDAKAVEDGLRNLTDYLNGEGKDSSKPLKYQVENWGASDKTGDIGTVQFRPSTAWLFQKERLGKYFKFSLHPNSLDAIKAAYLYLAWGHSWLEEATGKMQSKYGFIAERPQKMSLAQKVINKLKNIRRDAGDSWNPSLTESMLEWGDAYQKEVIDSGGYVEIDNEYRQQKAA